MICAVLSDFNSWGGPEADHGWNRWLNRPLAVEVDCALVEC